MSNTGERMLRVLDVIEAGPAAMSFEEVHASLGYTRSTLYRYLKTLTDAGLLTSLGDIGYGLGPRITELDCAMRDKDAMMTAARPVMAELALSVPGIALLCRRYRDKVLCVHQEQGKSRFASAYERGRARPLLRGAASRVILAYLRPSAVARLFAADPAGFSAAGLGDDLPAVRAVLKAIRTRGWDTSSGQVTPGITGVAAPLFDNSGAILGSLSISVWHKKIPDAELAIISDRVCFCASIVSKAVSVNPEG
jgi:DNA-binding IclR family transcriptional regulator